MIQSFNFPNSAYKPLPKLYYFLRSYRRSTFTGLHFHLFAGGIFKTSKAVQQRTLYTPKAWPTDRLRPSFLLQVAVTCEILGKILAWLVEEDVSATVLRLLQTLFKCKLSDQSYCVWRKENQFHFHTSCIFTDKIFVQCLSSPIMISFTSKDFSDIWILLPTNTCCNFLRSTSMGWHGEACIKNWKICINKDYRS